MQAAIYVRISHDPRGESLGVTRQREDCRALAETTGWTVADVYTDNDISATSGAPRPEYERMLRDIEDGRIGAIVAWHADRLYRRLKDLEGLIEVVERNNAKIRTVRAGEVDLSTPTGQMVAQILGAVSQAEGKVKSDRWRRSWRQRRELGRVTPAGWRTFGYKLDGTPEPAEADRVRTVVADGLAGKAIRTVCNELNAEGRTTTRGNPWTNTSLRVLLRNPRIAGYATYKGEQVGDGDWEPLVDRDDWRDLQTMLDTRTTDQHPRRWLLSGMLTCGACGHTLYSRPGRGYQTYKCLTGEGGCGKVDVKAERVDEMVQVWVRERISDRRLRRRLAELRSGGHGHVLAEMEALEHRLAEIEAQMADPGRSMQALVRAGDTIRDRIDELQTQLGPTTPVVLPAGDEWPDDLSRRRRIIAAVVQTITIDPSPGRGRFYPERVRIEGR